MAGGYARHVEDTVEIHLQTVRLAAQSAERYLMNTSEGRFDAPPLCCYNRSSPPHF
jgi:hypothetical protein